MTTPTLVRSLSLVTVALLLPGPACTRDHRAAEQEDSKAAVSPPPPATPQAGDDTDQRPRLGRGRGADRPRGNGLGRGSGRGRGRGRNRRQAIHIPPEQAAAVEFETVEVSQRSMDARLEVMGKVLPRQTHTAIVSYAFSARIAAVHVAIGDWVQKGQELVTLQSEEVGEARSAFYKARADRELAHASYEREKRLFDRGVGPQKSLLAAEAELKVAEASLDASEKKLHVLGFSEEQLRIVDETHQVNPIITLYAPLTGRIIQNQAVLGAMVDQSTEILTIMDPTTLWVDAEIYERDIARVRPGQRVSVSVPAYPNEAFEGHISYVGAVLKEETRTVTVRTEVGNQDQRLKPGMFADVEISLNGASEVLAVPERAVLDDLQEKIVFVAADGHYLLREVEVGAKHGGYLEVLSGLELGEQVVTSGNFALKSKLHDAPVAHSH